MNEKQSGYGVAGHLQLLGPVFRLVGGERVAEIIADPDKRDAI